MPFKIIRNDITKITADVIVNTTNFNPAIDNETDGFAFGVKYIIHTALPIWIDGKHGEIDLLKSYYSKSLIQALELGCESIAFPLASTSVYRFPPDQALQIAVSVFSSFLLENEMQIILVVSDKTSFQLPSQIVDDIDSYIDANYVKQKRNRECTRHFRKESIESDAQFEWSEDIVGVSFHNKLFELIEQSGIENKDVWKLANLDRKHFSKIQCDEKYHPKKKTVMALCIALQLDLDQSKDLLARADWAFSPSRKVDLIVQKAIIDKQYDIFQLNVILFKYTNETLGL